MKKWVKSVFNYTGRRIRGELSSKKRAELIADLARGVIFYGYDCTGFHTLEQTAGLIKNLSHKQLKQVVEEEGIPTDVNATRPSLVVKIVEYVFADVIEPTEASNDDQLGTHQAKKPRTKY